MAERTVVVENEMAGRVEWTLPPTLQGILDDMEVEQWMELETAFAGYLDDFAKLIAASMYVPEDLQKRVLLKLGQGIVAAAHLIKATLGG